MGIERGRATRPNLKVQDGCDNRCSFCIIPYVRGQSRSLPLEEALAQVRALVEQGYREVVISGINLGRWGRDLGPESRFEALVRAILEETELEKLRLSAVEPMDWTDELIGMMAASPRVARHGPAQGRPKCRVRPSGPARAAPTPPTGPGTRRQSSPAGGCAWPGVPRTRPC